MPLMKSASKAAFSKNVSEMIKAGHPQDQALAASYSIKQKVEGRAIGGVAPQMRNSGSMISQAMQPSMPGAGLGSSSVGAALPMVQPPANGVMPAALSSVMGSPNGLNAGMMGPAGSRGFAHGGVAGIPLPTTSDRTFKGPIVSAVPGRTDLHGTHVPSGSFVIPADIVSGHGEGNTLAGMHVLQKLFKMGAHVGNPSKIPGINPTLQKLAKGGAPADRHVGKPVPVKLAGGEIVVPPENVHETMSRVTGKKLSLSQSHAAMDQWVLKERKKLRKTLAKLPGPARD